jgi:signal transduction histidine kinase
LTNQALRHDVQRSEGAIVERSIGPKTDRLPTLVQNHLHDQWTRLTLSTRFLIASTLIVCTTMLLIGAWVDGHRKKIVVQNAGLASARTMHIAIQGQIQDIETLRSLSPSAKQVIADLTKETGLGRNIMQIKIWLPDGTIIHTATGSQIGEKPPITKELAGALAGHVMPHFNDEHDIESVEERKFGVPIFEVYAPIYRKGTSKVIAVAEFYEDASDLKREFDIARKQSWLIVGSLTFGMILLLFSIVQRGSLLHESAALSDKFLRRIGADLHDGPAQLLSLAVLRLHELVPASNRASRKAKKEAVEALAAIQSAAQDALAEIRNISSGVSLPELERLNTAEILQLAISKHEYRTKTQVQTHIRALPENLPIPVRTCIFRCVQEGLNNAFRHAGAQGQFVSSEADDNVIRLTVRDTGPGFRLLPSYDCKEALGLAGLRHRVELLGGSFEIRSRLGKGTMIMVTLPKAGPT